VNELLLPDEGRSGIDALLNGEQLHGFGNRQDYSFGARGE